MDPVAYPPLFWLIALLFGICFAGLAHTLMGAVRDATDSYSDLYAADTARQLDDIFLFIPPRRVLDMARAAGAGAFLLCFLVFGSPSTWRGLLIGLLFGTVGGLAALQAPRLLLQALKQRRLQRFNDQLVDVLIRMSNSLKAGFSILQAFETVVKEGQNPIAQEFGVFLHQTRVGVRFEDAMDQMETRVGSEDLTLTIRAIQVARLTGGNLTDVFEKIAETIRERNRIQGRVRALTSQGRLQGIVVGLLPVLLLTVLSFMDPKMISDFVGSVAGMVLLGLVVVLELAGALVIRRIIRIEV